MDREPAEPRPLLAVDPPATPAPATSYRSFALSRRGSSVLALLLLVAFFVQGALGVRHKSITNDEDTHLRYGKQILEQHTFARRIHLFNTTSPWLAINALAATMPGRLVAQPPPGCFLYAARLCTLVWGVLLGWLVFSWARQAFGPAAGILALTFFAFCPNLLAHSALATTDLITTLGIFAAVYSFWRLRAQPSRIRLCTAGVVLGLAMTTKLTSIYLLPIFLLVLVVEQLRARRFAWRPFLSLVPLFAIALLVLNVVYRFEGTFTPLSQLQAHSARFHSLAQVPVLRDVPLPLPSSYVQSLDWASQDVARGRWAYCLGRYSHDGFPYYYAVALLAKATVGLIAAIVLALACLRLRGAGRSSNAQLFLLVPIVFYFAYFSFFFAYQIGLRHLLPIFPFAFVLVSRLASLGRRWLAIAVWLLAAGHAASSLHAHPHYLAYFNEAVGGPLQGWRYLIDSNLDWGQDRQAARDVYPRHSPVPVIVDPGGPTVGRILVSVNDLVGLQPEAHARYAWLRESFAPIDHVGYSWLVYDVSAAALARCCAGAFGVLPESAGDLALEGRPIGGGDGVRVEGLARLTDGSLGSDSLVDPAYTVPSLPPPVAAWFGIEWRGERTIDRVVAYPGFFARQNRTRVHPEAAYVVQTWQGNAWVDVPGTRRAYRGEPRIEQRFAPVRTSKLRLWISAQRHDRPHRRAERIRIAVLELAAFAPPNH